MQEEPVVTAFFLDAVDISNMFAAVPAPDAFERHSKVFLTQGLPDTEGKLERDKDNDHPFEEIRVLDPHLV